MKDPRELLVGTMDLHVHCNPDVLPREKDDFELAERMIDCGMSGYCIKSHFFCTAQRAELVQKKYPQLNVIGALALNRAVGGVNPIAVELAARAGAKIIWFPSCDSINEIGSIDIDSPIIPPWAKIVRETRGLGVEYEPITILNDAGKLRPEVYDVLKIIKTHDVVLATSHLTHAETFALVKEAYDEGIKKIVITHCSGRTTFYTKEEQTELKKYGVLFEHVYTTYAKGINSIECIADQIRNVGAQNCILGTDLGPKGAKCPDEGILQFITDLQMQGLSDDEIKVMTETNNKELVLG